MQPPRYPLTAEGPLRTKGTVSDTHRPFRKVSRRKRDKVERQDKQLLLRTVAVIVSGNLDGAFKLIVVGEFFKGIQRSSAFLNVDRVQSVVRFHDKFQFGVRFSAPVEQPVPFCSQFARHKILKENAGQRIFPLI